LKKKYGAIGRVGWGSLTLDIIFKKVA